MVKIELIITEDDYKKLLSGSKIKKEKWFSALPESVKYLLLRLSEVQRVR